MNIFFRALLVLALSFSISCSRGGADDKATGNGGAGVPAGGGGGVAGKVDLSSYKNVNGTILGQWNSNTVYVGVSQNSIKIVSQCENGTMNELESRITLTTTEVKFQETKKTGTGACEIAYEAGTGFTYTVANDQLTVTFPTGQSGTLTRVETGGAAGGGNGATGADIVFFTGPNCTGQQLAYKFGMNCSAFNTSGNISSIKQTGGACQTKPQPQAAHVACTEINEIANRGGQ